MMEDAKSLNITCQVGKSNIHNGGIAVMKKADKEKLYKDNILAREQSRLRLLQQVTSPKITLNYDVLQTSPRKLNLPRTQCPLGHF